MSPFAFYLSRLCEEFPGRLPSELMEERDRLPYGLLDEILAARAYGRAYEANNADSDPARRQSTPMRTLANEIEFELAAEEIGTT